MSSFTVDCEQSERERERDRERERNSDRLVFPSFPTISCGYLCTRACISCHVVDAGTVEPRRQTRKDKPAKLAHARDVCTSLPGLMHVVVKGFSLALFFFFFFFPSWGVSDKLRGSGLIL